MNNALTQNLMKKLNKFFESEVEIPRIRVGEKQSIDTLINDEALIFAKFLRNECKSWKPRNANR